MFGIRKNFNFIKGAFMFQNFNLMNVLTEDHIPLPNLKSLSDKASKYYPYVELCSYNPYISIIGSFSSGKSSFINNISLKEMAPTDTTKTTSIPMFISKGKSDITIYTAFSQVITIGIDKLNDIIDQLRHNPDMDYRRYIDFLSLKYEEFPFDKVVLIDTPGYTGSDEDYEISKSIIDMSDGVIFMLDASRGDLTQEDIELLKYAKSKEAVYYVSIGHRIRFKLDT
jgi:signal recognition particle receptor subunit beta